MHVPGARSDSRSRVGIGSGVVGQVANFEHVAWCCLAQLCVGVFLILTLLGLLVKLPTDKLMLVYSRKQNEV